VIGGREEEEEVGDPVVIAMQVIIPY